MLFCSHIRSAFPVTWKAYHHIQCRCFFFNNDFHLCCLHFLPFFPLLAPMVHFFNIWSISFFFSLFPDLYACLPSLVFPVTKMLIPQRFYNSMYCFKLQLQKAMSLNIFLYCNSRAFSVKAGGSQLCLHTSDVTPFWIKSLNINQPIFLLVVKLREVVIWWR